jgi:hypothetical protein
MRQTILYAPTAPDGMRPTLPIHSQVSGVPLPCPSSDVAVDRPSEPGLLTMAIFHAAGHSTLTLLTVGRDVAPSDLGASGRPVLPSPGAHRRAGGRGDPAAYRGPSPPEPIGRGGLSDSTPWAKNGTTSPRKRPKVSRGWADPARSTTCGGVPAIIPRPEIALHIVEDLGVGQESKLIAALTAKSSARG